MDKWQALYNFYNSFDVNAYEENSIPDDRKNDYPRITYQSGIDEFENEIQLDCSVWDLNNSWANVDRIVNAIEAKAKNMGCPKIEGGRLRVHTGSPFAQRMKDPENDNIKRTVVHLQFEFMTT